MMNGRAAAIRLALAAFERRPVVRVDSVVMLSLKGREPSFKNVEPYNAIGGIMECDSASLGSNPGSPAKQKSHKIKSLSRSWAAFFR